MKINEKMSAELNQHLHREWSAHYAFLATSAWFETTPFKGFAKALLERSEREHRHALKIFMYLKERLGVVELGAVEQPRCAFGSALEAFEQALAVKHALTSASHSLYVLAGKERDYQTQEFLHEFLQEQIQEEKHMQDHVDKVTLAGDHPDALIHLDYKEEHMYQSTEKM
jgi:ferritin